MIFCGPGVVINVISAAGVLFNSPDDMFQLVHLYTPIVQVGTSLYVRVGTSLELHFIAECFTPSSCTRHSDVYSL